MGNFIGSVESVDSDVAGQNKRKLDEIDEDQHSSPRKKLQTTSEYIYKTLYINGENSDIVLEALDKKWHLHKVYLCQSMYFRSMFKGDWSEKHEPYIKINFPDDLITTKALDIAFGSMYSCEVDVNVLIANLIPVIAASRMFDLNGLLNHCKESMLEGVNAENVCIYHEAASRYGLTEVKKRCFAWLERNILLCNTKTLTLAKQLSKELIKRLLCSRDLVVMQVEMDIYNFLKIWMYLQLYPSSECTSVKKLVVETQKFFQQSKSDVSFLLTVRGSEYVDVFQCLRLENMLGDVKCITLLEKDFIIPPDWLLPVYKTQWKAMLKVYHGEENGPKSIDEAVFYKQSCRCGRILETDVRYCWRWTGLFSYGVDMILIYNNRTRTLSVKRNTYGQPCNFPVSLQSQRSVVLRFKAFTLTSSGVEKLCKDTGVILWNFHTDEEVPLVMLDETWEFPIYVSTQFLLSSDCTFINS